MMNKSSGRDPDAFDNCAIYIAKQGVCDYVGRILHLVPYMHPDPNSEEKIIPKKPAWFYSIFGSYTIRQTKCQKKHLTILIFENLNPT